MVYSTHDIKELPKQQSNFLFSFLFALAVLLLVQLLSVFTFIYNLIILPFTIIHELSHCVALGCFFPGKEAQIEFHLFENGVTCANVKFESLPLCFGSVISLLIGPLSTIILSIIGILVLRRGSSSAFNKAGSHFLKFVILCDLPNLFPIHPPMINAVTDGYAASVCLFQMGYIPFISTELSIIFFIFASIISFAAMFNLGTTAYFLLHLIKVTFSKENRSFHPHPA